MGRIPNCSEVPDIIYFIGAGGFGGRGAPPADNTPAQRQTPLTPPLPNPPFFKFSSRGFFKQDIRFPRNPPPLAWTVLRARHARLNRPEGHWVTKASSYTDCLSYVLALESSNQQQTPLIHRMLMDCRAMSTSFKTPRHIHSHRSGTVMDSILDAVDTGAKRFAHRQRPRCGWICQLDEPQVTFSVQDKQKHDFQSYLERSVSKPFCHTQHVVYAPYDMGYDLYEEVVMHGEIL